MTLDQLRSVAKVSKEGWLVSWTSKGYIVSKGLDPDMRLEIARGGVRYILSLDAVARIMADELGVPSYLVRGRIPGQPELF